MANGNAALFITAYCRIGQCFHEGDNISNFFFSEI